MYIMVNSQFTSDPRKAGTHAVRVAFTLTAISTGTRVDLVHSNLPDPSVPGHTLGWSHFLERLARSAAGENPGPDEWMPGTMDA